MRDPNTVSRQEVVEATRLTKDEYGAAWLLGVSVWALGRLRFALKVPSRGR